MTCRFDPCYPHQSPGRQRIVRGFLHAGRLFCSHVCAFIPGFVERIGHHCRDNFRDPKSVPDADGSQEPAEDVRCRDDEQRIPEQRDDQGRTALAEALQRTA